MNCPNCNQPLNIGKLIGALGGRVKSEAKTRAARRNAKLPRPRKTVGEEIVAERIQRERKTAVVLSVLFMAEIGSAVLLLVRN